MRRHRPAMTVVAVPVRSAEQRFRADSAAGCIGARRWEVCVVVSRRNVLRWAGAAVVGGDAVVGTRPERWARLRDRLSGELLLPGEVGYDTARLPFNSLFDHHRPAAIARCARPQDVRLCLDEARESGVRVAARGGGHSYAAYSTPHEGLVVDLAPMAAVEVRSDGTAVVGAGARLREVYAALTAAGRCLPLGNCPSVGIAGFTLGGGLGWVDRTFGLACDWLRSARVVTVDGRLLTASAECEPDLFWALRGGGGGNFGVVTSFEFATVPVPEVLTVFRLRFPAGSAADVLGAWQPWSVAVPDEVSSVCVAAPDGSVDVTGCAVGPEGVLLGELARLRAAIGVDAPLEHAEVDYPTATGIMTGGHPTRNAFRASSRIADRMWDDPTAVVETLRGRESALLIIGALGGAIDRRGATDTAYPHRGAPTSVEVFGTVGDLRPERVTREVDQVQTALARLIGTGTYINYLDPRQEDWARTAYRHNLPRLRAIARRYDPDGVLRFPQSLR
ncbi:FAD/FMN-containing dehydrogenase [Saccharothrix coeruleofusca]|uniref:FAD-binding oxidoreductase n=1 Tax=Saccharothrix coeruleofusca TaxID=33919 RepID=UPI001AE3C0A3|nr:FAD-binding oxidoreductase [Saccharothrix coeruleofusca]MBP2337328.1 FAD/FMN-containing dehydrogenase [Saccharothrix coeruleofusca]